MATAAKRKLEDEDGRDAPSKVARSDHGAGWDLESHYKALLCSNPFESQSAASPPPLTYPDVDNYLSAQGAVLDAVVIRDAHRGLQSAFLDESQSVPVTIDAVEHMEAFASVTLVATPVAPALGEEPAPATDLPFSPYDVLLLATEAVKSASAAPAAFLLGMVETNGASVVIRTVSGGEDERVRRSAQQLIPGARWHALVISNAAASASKADLLANARHVPLLRASLNPSAATIIDATALPEDSADLLASSPLTWDADQSAAIRSSLALRDGFLLLQGPPATGKTSVLASITVALAEQLARRVSYSAHAPVPDFDADRVDVSARIASAPRRVVALAPTSGELDTLFSAFLKARRTAAPAEGDLLARAGFGLPRTVRIGTSNSSEAAVRAMSLEEVVDSILSATQDSAALEARISAVAEERARLAESGSDLRRLRDLECEAVVLAECAAIHRAGGALSADADGLRTILLLVADVVFASAQDAAYAGRESAALVVDAAGRISETDVLLAAGFATRAVLSGMQNPRLSDGAADQACVNAGSAVAATSTLFGRLVAGGHPVAHLSIQHRMLAETGYFFRATVYNNTVTDGPQATATFTLKGCSAYTVHEIMGAAAPTAAMESEDEALQCVSVYSSFLEINAGELRAASFAILTPYAAQKARIMAELATQQQGAQEMPTVATVAEFRGHEADVVIFSVVGSSTTFPFSSADFAIALSRAKRALYIICSSSQATSAPLWAACLTDAKARNRHLSSQPRRASVSGARTTGTGSAATATAAGSAGLLNVPNQRTVPPAHYVCHKCHRQGHWIQYCPSSNASTPPAGYICRKCNLPGHYIKDCAVGGTGSTMARVSASTGLAGRAAAPRPGFGMMGGYGMFGAAAFGARQPAGMGMPQVPLGNYVCRRCNQPGHFIRDCPLAPRQTGVPPPGYLCKKCNVPGHFIQNCPMGNPRPAAGVPGQAGFGGYGAAGAAPVAGQQGYGAYGAAGAAQAPASSWNQYAQSTQTYGNGAHGHYGGGIGASATYGGQGQYGTTQQSQFGAGAYGQGHGAQGGQSGGVPPPGYVCKKCNIPGHFIKDCTAAVTTGPPRGYVCRICNVPGHLIQQCPQKQGGSAGASSYGAQAGYGGAAQGAYGGGAQAGYGGAQGYGAQVSYNAAQAGYGAAPGAYGAAYGAGAQAQYGAGAQAGYGAAGQAGYGGAHAGYGAGAANAGYRMY